ncbi:LOW QUALITY PROTEIN: tripartite motif-containing protein 16-like protein [Cottoperca gobio]|uniref:LOW QUALITY PROTEIN: tripartite motif-containing protein 16-like protein n=1 Tax=Cottoperca gobio TaxID=56716 RepID=A0A6J2RPB5_COTGO|nr:LOW QUALITY PROTEIN: tripartite motif-containing protein 16-like protein [Cottoperca gobio]
MNSKVGGKATQEEKLLKHQLHLQKQRDGIAYRMKKLAAKQVEITKKTTAVKEKIKKKYEDMKRVLDEDLRITLTQLDVEYEATEKLVEDRIEDCYHLTQELDQELSKIGAHVKPPEIDIQLSFNEMRRLFVLSEIRIIETLKLTDPDLIQMDEFKYEQLLSLTINLLLFIRSQVPVTKKLFQTYAADVVLDADSAHPKLIISPKGDSVTYTDTWQDVPETSTRFDTTLNVVSQQGFSEGRQYWEVDVSGKTYWELGLTYPSIPRKGREEDSWLGRGKESWCVEYFNGDYTAWHGGVQQELPLLAGKQFTRIGVYCSFPGGLVCFLGADTMTPLHCFGAGTFTDILLQALCPGHDNEGTNWKSLKVCDASRSAPVL